LFDATGYSALYIYIYTLCPEKCEYTKDVIIKHTNFAPILIKLYTDIVKSIFNTAAKFYPNILNFD